jgi:hypothetical protein
MLFILSNVCVTCVVLFPPMTQSLLVGDSSSLYARRDCARIYARSTNQRICIDASELDHSQYRYRV